MDRSSKLPSGFRRRIGRILVVDDEQLLGVAMRRILDGENEVIAVPQGAEALARLDAGERYDVVFCDLKMPEMDGIEFHRRLSLTLPEEAARIVFITGGALTARAEAFFRDAPNLLMAKPLDMDGVRQLIERRHRGVPPAKSGGQTT